MKAMFISLAESRTAGFKKWSDGHRSDNDDDNSGEANPNAVTEPPRDDREAIQEPPHAPWRVPGTDGSF
jgi:hypothetical protein